MIRRVAAALRPLALDDRDDLVAVADEQRRAGRGTPWPRSACDHLDALAGDAEPVALPRWGRRRHAESRTAWVTSPATTLRRRLGHGVGVGVDVGLGVVGEQGGEALADAPGGHDAHRLGRLRVDLLGHRDDVLVVRQDHDLVGRAGLDGGEQVGGRRVHGLAAGDDPLHAEAVEDPPDAVADGDGDDRGGDGLGGVGRLVDRPPLATPRRTQRSSSSSRPARGGR